VVNDGHGNMLVGAKRAGLIVFRNGSMTGQQLPLLYRGKMMADYTVKTLYTGRDGQIWVSVDKTGIGVYDAHAGVVIIKCEGSINVNCFLQVHNDTLLAGTANTLYQYAISSSRLSPYKLQNGDSLQSGLVRSLCEDGSGRCWVGSDGNGISIVDVATHRLLPIENSIGRQTISSNAINCLYKDADQRIWIGTLRGGVNMIDHDRKPFYSVKLADDKNKNPANNFIFSFCEDKNGDIWIGTDGGGISVWNRRTNQFKKYTSTTGMNGLLMTMEIY
jgi:ligand-binding sensor domain-containing protein